MSRNSWCAGNLAGEFQNQTFSPVFNVLLITIWSFPLSLADKAAALAVIHLIWLAAGVFVLGRHRGLSVSLATMAALATALSGWNITWAATDWITFLVGFSWLPWVWWSLAVAITSGSVWKRWLRPGIFAALMVMSGHAFGVGMMGIVGLWLALRAIIRDRDWSALRPLIFAGVLGAGLSAPAWLLMIELARSSARWDTWSVVQRGWVVPWRAWIGLVLPSFVTSWPDFTAVPLPHVSLELACGLVPITALFAALIFCPLATMRKLRWELAFLGVCIFLVSMPSFGLFRWSFRWLQLFHLVLALTAATALQQGLAKRAPFCGVVLAGVALVAAIFLDAIPTLAASIFGVSVAWYLVDRFGRRGWAEWMLAAVVPLTMGLTLWFIPTHQAVPKYALTDKILDPAPLDPNRLYLSLYSFREIVEAHLRQPPYGNILRPMDTMQYADLRFVNGYSSFEGRDVKGLFQPHGSIEPAKAESLAGPEGERFLSFVGVDGIVFSREYLPFAGQLGPEWEKVAEAPEGVAFHRKPTRFTPVKALKYVADRPGVPLAQPEIRIISERRNSVIVAITPSAVPTIGAEGNSDTLAVAPIAFVRPFLQGYRAFFNGVPVPVREYGNILPIVELPADARGRLELRYRPKELIYGIALTVLSLGVMLLIALLGRKRPAAR